VAIACNSGEIQIRKSITDLGLTLTTIKASDKWINSMRYSPNGDMLAVGTQVGEIKLYEASKYTFVHTFNDQKVYIASMDWSIDGKYLRTNNGESVLKIYNIAAKEVDNTCGESTKDSEWATQSCKIAWNSLGVLLPGSNHSFINSICISHANDLLITGDDSCLVNIFNNPHPTYSLNSYISLRGHSNHVKRVELSNDDEYLFSIGDCSLLQWKRSKK
jgi:WD40 repeat protein